MHRFALDSYQHLAPPYKGIIEEWLQELPQQELRKMWKRLGLPASNARVLGEMAAALKSKTEHFLGHPISKVAGSFPKFVALYDEEVLDAFEWVGPEYQQVYLTSTCLIRPIASVYAAAGFGLCSDYKTRLHVLRNSLEA